MFALQDDIAARVVRTLRPALLGEGPGTSPARLFAVRLWKEELSGGCEYRGSVRDVRTDAFRGFRDWSDLVAFMVGRLEREAAGDVEREGGTDVDA